MELFSGIKRNELLTHTSTWMTQNHYTERKNPRVFSGIFTPISSPYKGGTQQILSKVDDSKNKGIKI